jgi:hypothetical protein
MAAKEIVVLVTLESFEVSAEHVSGNILILP